MGPPEHLGSYRLLSSLGAGGFGAVYLALDPGGRTVAVKVLHPHVAADAVAIARLAREVETMRLVRGRHVAEVLDASLTGERPYIVTRYVQGRPLNAVLSADGPLAGDDLVRLARGLAEALESIHAAGVVHRDLKPANVIVSDGEPYVIDFGIACALESASVTASGAVVGTPGYLAPEVLEGRDAGPAADVFAWAATVAFAASGRQPYGTGPATAVAFRVVHREPDLSGTPSWLAPLLAECLRSDPALRPSATDLINRLDLTRPPGDRPGRRDADRPWAAAVTSEAASGSAAGTTSGAAPAVTPAGGHQGGHPGADAGDEAVTRAWRPGDPRRSVDDLRARHRRKLHRRWVAGSAVVVGLFAAAARDNLPEVSLLLLVLYGIGLLVDAGFGLAARSRERPALDAAGGVGAVAVWALLSSLFSTGTLLLAVGTVVIILLMLVFAS
ncbi:serine/threonine protein kinase [Microbispora sp. RL4-1S]|uniref:Serine/threonine protein kinase n=1 Tax=Microbispora oryzae TaxID=2806554 RepID=A0A941AGU8_9ACTN|nr:serine/threonine-protein kinase [Microbispora oryzae]MBP2703345.1 serine/threonine protein kinase [Microbispora oryzae]